MSHLKYQEISSMVGNAYKIYSNNIIIDIIYIIIKINNAMKCIFKMVESSFDASLIETHCGSDGSKWSKMVLRSFDRSSIETHDGPDGLKWSKITSIEVR